MSVALCTITGALLDPTGTGIAGANVKTNIVSPFLDANNNLLIQKETQVTTDSSGNFTLSLVQGSSVVVAMEFPPNSTDSNRRQTFSILVPFTLTASFSNLVTET